MQSDTSAVSRQAIVDQLAALHEHFCLEQQALEQKYRAARDPIEAKCAALGHVVRADRLCGRDVLKCVVCGAPGSP